MELLVKYFVFASLFNTMATRKSRADAEQNLDGATRSPVASSKGTVGSGLGALTRILLGVATVVALGALLLWTGFWASVAWWHVTNAEFVGLGMTLVFIVIPFGLVAWHFELGSGVGKALGGA